MKRPATIHRRMITVVSGHPPNSKWWWSGAIRKTRRPSSRKLPTWRMTDTVSMTKSPPMMGNRSAVLVDSASAARPAPMANEPVSPMKIFAGAAFHHRKPAQAPSMAAATTAVSRKLSSL